MGGGEGGGDIDEITAPFTTTAAGAGIRVRLCFSCCCGAAVLVLVATRIVIGNFKQ